MTISDFAKQAKQADPHRFHFRSASDLCCEPAPVQWLIKPLLDTGSLANLFGESGTMKTFVGLDVGLSVATGRDWHAHTVKTQGPVFYIAGEGFSGINRRIKAWALHNKVDLADVPFYVSDRPTQFLNNDAVAEMVEAVDELAKTNGAPVLIIVDTLNRNFGPGDENSTTDMTKFISAVDDALRVRYHCTVLIIHHTGLSALERARGASALRAALDWEYRLQKNEDGTRVLTCTKAKDHVEPAPISFVPQVVTLDGWLDEDGEVVTSCVLVKSYGTATRGRPLTGTLKIAYDVLLRIGAYNHIDAWRDHCYAAGLTPSSNREAKKKAFQRAVMGLRNRGYIATKDDVYWPVTYSSGTTE